MLGKEGLGLYSYVNSLTIPLWVAIEFGMDTYLVRELSASPERSHELCSEVTSFRLAFSLLLFLTFIPLMAVLQQEPVAAIGCVVFGLGFLARALYTPYFSMLRSQQRYYHALRFDIVGAVFLLASTIIILTTTRSLLAIIVATAAVDLLKLFPALHLYKREVGHSLLRSLNVRFSRYKNIIKITLPFALVNLMSILQSRTDILLLEHFRSTAEVGIYSAGERFINALTILPGAMFNGLLPLFSRSRGESFSRKFSFQSILVFSLVGVVISSILFFAAPFIISITFRFSESVIILQILAWSFSFFMFNTLMESWLYGHRYERFVVYARIFGVVAIICTNIYFAPRYGATGTAIATILSECLLSCVFASMLLVKRRRSEQRNLINSNETA